VRDLGIMLAAFIVGALGAIILSNTSSDIGGIFAGLLCVLPACLGAGFFVVTILRSRDRARANAEHRVIQQAQAAEQQQLEDQRQRDKQQMEDILSRYAKR